MTMVTALVRDLKLTYGDRYAIDVQQKFPAVWRNNPHLTPLNRRDPQVRTIYLDYRSSLKLPQEGKLVHYVSAFHRIFEAETKIHVPLLFPKPDLHLSEEEKSTPLISGRYWIVVPGGKLDMTNKWWPTEYWEEVIQKLRPWGLRFVQEGAAKKLHEHAPVHNVLNMVGLTGQRDLMRNVYHAEGVICGVSFPMHLAGAFDRPCVVIAGGREEPWWEAYCNDFRAFGPQCAPVKMPHQFLHTLGQLPCCEHKGCWRRRVVPLGDDRPKYDEDLCYRPLLEFTPPRPTCMEMIKPGHVMNAVMRYYEEKFLPPPLAHAQP
jgi:hypothetical protein